MTFRLCEAEIIVGETVIGEQRLDDLGQQRVERAGARRAPRERRHLAERRLEKRLDLRAQLAARREGAEPLDERRRLDERVVGDAGHRRVAAAAVHGERNGADIFSAVAQR